MAAETGVMQVDAARIRRPNALEGRSSLDLGSRWLIRVGSMHVRELRRRPMDSISTNELESLSTSPRLCILEVGDDAVASTPSGIGIIVVGGVATPSGAGITSSSIGCSGSRVCSGGGVEEVEGWSQSWESLA